MAHRSSPRRRVLLAVLSSLVCVSGLAGFSRPAAAADTEPIYLDTHYSFQERAADLVSRMTLDEKVQQLNSDGIGGIPRLGVQDYSYGSEGQHGVNDLGNDTDPGPTDGGAHKPVHATSFPSNFAATMSWDKSLMYQETTAISDEARGFLDKSLWGVAQNDLGLSAANYGALSYWAPNVNMDRDPRWGRTNEAFGEDPYLVAQMAGAYVNGDQGQTPDGKPTGKYLKVAATAKHYSLYNVEDNRFASDSVAGDADIHDYYTAPFKSLIENSHVAGLMTAYDEVNGTPTVANTYLDNQIAQRSYGFDGYTTSDCGGVETVYGNGGSGANWAPPGWTTDKQGRGGTWTDTATGQKIPAMAGGQAWALRAGTDSNCGGPEATPQNIGEAIKDGVLSEGVIDNALVHMFTVRMETGEFDPPSENPYTKITKDVIQSPAHQSLARKVADNSLVLLKNDKVAGTNAPLLPADPAKLGKVVILGNLADQVTLGGYSSSPKLQVSAVQGITDQVKAAHPGADVVFDAANTSSTANSGTPAVLSARTTADIKSADLVVVFVGTTTDNTNEGLDRGNLNMPGNYDSLISQVTAIGNPRTALAIQSDGPVRIDDVQGEFPAVVYSSYNGESQGDALADVLFGKQNPSGHLDFTWYKDASQLPAMSDYGLTPAATGGLGRTYQYFTGTPTYPFGYGLSYSTFAYSHIKADRSSVSADGTVKVGFDVRNTGSVPGATVAQLYASTPFSVPGVELPKERLAGFEKTRVLQPGTGQHVVLQVKVSDLALWDSKAAKNVVHDGPYRFQVGPDAADIAGAATVDVHGTWTPKVQTVTVQPENVEYTAGETLDLTGRNQWIKDDTTPANEPDRNMSVQADHVVEAVANDGSFLDLAKAHVRYSSSDPSVATVDGKGLVTAVGNGVATIKATVDGVTGSVPITVHHTLAVTAPQIAKAGSTTTVTTTYTNSGSRTLRNASVALTPASGLTVRATSPTAFAAIAPGRSVTSTWQITAPADAKPGSYPLSARATYAGARSDDETVGQVVVAYPSVSATFDNVGISDDASPGEGDFDGGGRSFSAQTLAAAGLTPGAQVTHDGVTFTWPNSAPGTPDNVIAGGQSFPLTGTGGTLGFLATGAGDASGTGTVTYTDGTTQAYSLAVNDWTDNNAPAPGSDILATLPHRNASGGGSTDIPVHVYGTTVALQPGKTVAYLTLPDAPSLHVFATAIG
ncbi:glycoside hydrolase family 3 C-terminal domain-containing protein [Streptomyces sp. NBC_00448]|uniref:glycoside hydrolase family 3 C-terminal domain-containing protein n=1 Tax=Streptomyces sp. NBC_00448 TaxID=2903652 RepID=UPI002E244FF7